MSPIGPSIVGPDDRCEFVLPDEEVNCDRLAVGFVGVDATPYCERHIDVMWEREAAST